MVNIDSMPPPAPRQGVPPPLLDPILGDRLRQIRDIFSKHPEQMLRHETFRDIFALLGASYPRLIPFNEAHQGQVQATLRLLQITLDRTSILDKRTAQMRSAMSSMITAILGYQQQSQTV
jgi:hypothetical protein